MITRIARPQVRAARYLVLALCVVTLAAADATAVEDWLQLARDAHGDSFVGGRFRQIVQPGAGVGPLSSCAAGAAAGQPS